MLAARWRAGASLPSSGFEPVGPLTLSAAERPLGGGFAPYPACARLPSAWKPSGRSASQARGSSFPRGIAPRRREPSRCFPASPETLDLMDPRPALSSRGFTGSIARAATSRALPSDDSLDLHGVRPRATDPVAAERLWRLSERLTRTALGCAGTPLPVESPRSGLELPLKALAWGGRTGKGAGARSTTPSSSSSDTGSGKS